MSVYDIDGNLLTSVYAVNGAMLNSAYNVDGNLIFSKEPPFVPSLTLLHSTQMSSIGDGILTPQGLAIYGNYYFQFFTGDNKMRVFNKHTFEKVGEYLATDIKHANVMQFGTSVQDNGFPLLYVSEWGDSGTVDSKNVDVLKIDLTGYTKVNSFTLPTIGGYHPAFVGDWTNNVAYSVGYETTETPSVSQQNIVTKYDLTNMTILEQYYLPYMGVINGLEYYNGKLIVCGNAWNGVNVTYHFIDVDTHNVTQYEFPKTSDEEFEGMSVDESNLFISNWTRTNGVIYYKIYTMNLI